MILTISIEVNKTTKLKLYTYHYNTFCFDVQLPLQRPFVLKAISSILIGRPNKVVIFVYPVF